jgi:hypothetical protein
VPVLQVVQAVEGTVEGGQVPRRAVLHHQPVL